MSYVESIDEPTEERTGAVHHCMGTLIMLLSLFYPFIYMYQYEMNHYNLQYSNFSST